MNHFLKLEINGLKIFTISKTNARIDKKVMKKVKKIYPHMVSKNTNIFIFIPWKAQLTNCLIMIILLSLTIGIKIDNLIFLNKFFFYIYQINDKGGVSLLF